MANLTEKQIERIRKMGLSPKQFTGEKITEADRLDALEEAITEIVVMLIESEDETDG